VLEETNQTEELVERVAALDIGKKELTCCIRVPGAGGRGKRLQEVGTYQTMTRSLLVLADRLGELGVTRVVMEATSDYWRPVFYLLEAQGLEVWLVNAREVKHLPGRPRPTGWMRCGWPSWPSGACCGPVSCRPRRSGGCGT
jgi:transposase